MRADLLEKRIAQKQAKCRHFTGVQHKTCDAGVNYESLPKGRIFDVCLAATTELCALHQVLTREAAEAEVRADDLAFARVDVCRAAITDKHGSERGVQGVIPCPTNCGGDLRYSIARVNGHIHAACSTPGCASWME